MKHLLGIEELTIKEITQIFAQAAYFKKILTRPIHKETVLDGKTVVNLFCEPSTRTRVSFELAAKRLGADVINIDSISSSFQKGETLLDTIKNLEAMQIDILVIRHSCAGTAHFLAQNSNISIINAGDGAHEHPTQALLDVFTIKEKLKEIAGLNITIIGDIAHSRVAYSNILALKKLGANVTVCGPKTLMPAEIEKLGVTVSYNLAEAIAKADAINILRIQLERQNEAFLPSLEEYRQNFGITTEVLKKYAKKNVLIMHPGPINRDIEISSAIADGKNSVILEQTANGVAIRMAILTILGTGKCIL